MQDASKPEATAPQPKAAPKHIVLCIDGTWQAAFSDIFQSNVYRINLALERHDAAANPQIFIYSSGLGTANWSSRYAAGALGEGMDELILQAYTNLVSNYHPGDKIYIFGFSRGAVAARALAGFMNWAGLLRAGASSLIGDAWRFYTGQEQTQSYYDRRADSIHKDVRIEFLGLWDAVPGPFGREGLVRRYKFEGHDLFENVNCCVHLLSADDTRAAFEPILWSGLGYREQKLEQIWMPGVHGDVGGGYERSFISTLSLLVMLDKLASYCPALAMNESYVLETLLPIVKLERVVINNEWKGYLGWKERRRIVPIINGGLHLRHPIINLMIGKECTIKRSRANRYEPLFEYSTGQAVLEEARFEPTSWHARQILTILHGQLR